MPLLTAVEFGGSPLPMRVYELIRRRLCPNVVSMYGATEAGAIAAGAMATLIEHAGAVGFVAPGVDVQAVDADDRALSPGVEGTLRVRRSTCVDAYARDTRASASAFREGWFYPGDVGTVSADGLLTVTGRSSEIINIGGMKIAPRVIEEVLLSRADVKEAAAFGVPDAMGNTRIWAAIVASEDADLSELVAHCTKRLTAFAPTRFLNVKELPRIEAGKVKRDELERIAVARLATDSRAAQGSG